MIQTNTSYPEWMAILIARLPSFIGVYNPLKSSSTLTEHVTMGSMAKWLYQAKINKWSSSITEHPAIIIIRVAASFICRTGLHCGTDLG